MPTISADFHLLDGDTAPAAPDAGFSRFFFLSGRPMMRRPGQAPIDLMPRWAIHFNFAGEATDEQLFGRHTVPEAVYVTRLELEAQEAPVGSALQVELVDASGAAFSPARTVSIADGEFLGIADITDLAVAVAATIRARIKSVGSSTPGGYLTLRITITPQ
jgi:hypothetical protein